jgi:hypothetical protein
VRLVRNKKVEQGGHSIYRGGYGCSEFWTEMNSRWEGVNHWSSSTVALNGVRTQGSKWPSTMTNYDVVSWHMAWHDRDKRWPPRRWPPGHIAGQVGTAGRTQSNPL